MMLSRVVPALMALALLVVSCAAPAESAPGGSQVVAELFDNKITVNVPSMKAGMIKIGVRNLGTMEHSFQVIKTDFAPDKLPVDGASAKAKEDGKVGEIARSNEAPGRPVASAFASTSSSSSPYFVFSRRAVSSCAGVMSTPTTRRAPPRFSQADTYAVPQPSSTTSFPRTAGRTFTLLSGVFHTPHEISCSFQACSARPSVYAALFFVQWSRLTLT